MVKVELKTKVLIYRVNSCKLVVNEQSGCCNKLRQFLQQIHTQKTYHRWRPRSVYSHQAFMNSRFECQLTLAYPSLRDLY